MSTAEEPVTTPAEDATAPEVVSTPAEPAAAEPAAPPVATGEPVDLVALLEAEFDGATDDPALDDVAKTANEAMLKNLPPEMRALLRATLRANKAKIEAALTPLTKREEELKAKEAAVKEAERRANQLRRAAIEMAAKREKPGDAPQADLLTAEGIRAHLQHEAKVAAWEQAAPAREEADRLAQQEAWDTLCDKYPDLRKADIGGEGGAFDKFYLEEINKGLDLTKQAPRMPAELAADLFFARREAEALKASREAASRAATTERINSARAVGRSAGTGAPDPLAYVKQLEASRDADKDAKIMAYLSTNPAAKAAYLQRYA